MEVDIRVKKSVKFVNVMFEIQRGKYPCDKILKNSY